MPDLLSEKQKKNHMNHARTIKRKLNETQKLITDVEIRLHRLRHRKKR
jgi:hypothetical protein